VLCPSFYRADIVHNARWYDRLVARWRDAAIDWLRRRGGDAPAVATS
jgi:indolepyruvate ferredoxin oxidoreductase, alpha subunit